MAGYTGLKFKSALERRVQGTPTFFINGEQHVGACEFEDLVFSMEQQLHSPQKPAS